MSNGKVKQIILQLFVVLQDIRAKLKLSCQNKTARKPHVPVRKYDSSDSSTGPHNKSYAAYDK